MHLNLNLLLLCATSLTTALPNPNLNPLTQRADSSNPVVAAVEKISTQTTTLNSTVAGYSGGIEGTITAIKVETEAICLNTDLREAVHTVSKLGNFTDAESQDIALSFINLVPTVNSTLATIVSKKDEFDDGLLGVASLSFLVKYNLETEKELSVKLGDEVKGRLTPDFASVAPLVLGQIKEAFTHAIQAYS